KAIIDLLPDLVKMKVAILFVENIKYDLFQKDLDDLFLKKIKFLSSETMQALEALDRKHGLNPPYRYTDLVLKAIDAGLRVVGTDTVASAEAGCYPNMALDKPKRIVA